MEEGKALGKPEIKSDGTMTFDYFLESSKIIFKYTLEQTKDGLAEMAAKRREAIKESND